MKFTTARIHWTGYISIGAGRRSNAGDELKRPQFRGIILLNPAPVNYHSAHYTVTVCSDNAHNLREKEDKFKSIFCKCGEELSFLREISFCAVKSMALWQSSISKNCFLVFTKHTESGNPD